MGKMVKKEYQRNGEGLCSRNVCPGTIYITDRGSWSLGGLEHAGIHLSDHRTTIPSVLALYDQRCLAKLRTTGDVNLDASLMKEVRNTLCTCFKNASLFYKDDMD